jgi:hypothetical protein
MAQADQTVQNNTFPTVRADINNNLAALFSNSSGPSEPLTTVAYMDWIDTSGANPVWKKRNAANNAWVTIGTIDGNDLELESALPSQSGNNGKYLTTDGTDASWATIASTGQLLRAPQVLTSGTTYTTPVNCTSIYVECVGGGGGGAAGSTSGGGGGGGAGAYTAKLFTVTPSTSYTYAIGAGSSSTGGSTTFTVGGTTITAGGGGAGLGAFVFTGGVGGTATNGDININGTGGGSGDRISSGAGGAGGPSFFGGGAQGNSAVGTSGGGGGGAQGVNLASGGAGGAGLIRIWEYS